MLTNKPHAAILSQSEGFRSHKWRLNDHENNSLPFADHEPIMPGSHQSSKYDMDQISHQLEQLEMGSAGGRESRPKKSRASHHAPLFDDKKDYAAWHHNAREAYNNGDYKGPQKYPGSQQDREGNFMERHTGYTPTTPAGSREASTDTWKSGQWVSQSSCGTTSDDGFNVVRESRTYAESAPPDSSRSVRRTYCFRRTSSPCSWWLGSICWSICTDSSFLGRAIHSYSDSSSHSEGEIQRKE